MQPLAIKTSTGVGGLAPKYPKHKKLNTKSVKATLYQMPRYRMDLTELLSSQGNKNQTPIDTPIAITPDNLSGIARKFAY